MDEKEQNKTNEIQKAKKTNKFEVEITGLDIDKIEYQEIVLSNSNFPDRNYFKPSYYD